MFKFNFQVHNTDEGILKDEPSNEKKTETADSLVCYESEKVEIDTACIEKLDVYRANSTSEEYESTEIFYVLSGTLKEILDEKGVDINRADEKHSDLLPGVYEGGAKIWECTIDLLRYMSKHLKNSDFKNKRTLDLGCGAGLLGIYALKNDSYVQFQDYNKDVLQTITIPNVLLNLPHSENIVEQSDKRISFYSGDWSKFTQFTRLDQKFDIILTSETIYNTNNYKKLIQTFKEKLKNSGIVLLAAKVQYFGVGGGVQQFLEHLKVDDVFISKSVWSSTIGVHREILEIRYKDDKKD